MKHPGEIGDFMGVPILTDHRMRRNTMIMLGPDMLTPDWSDRSMVRDDCGCSYCRWTPKGNS